MQKTVRHIISYIGAWHSLTLGGGALPAHMNDAGRRKDLHFKDASEYYYHTQV